MTNPGKHLEAAETEADRQRRFTWEAQQIAGAQADIEAGLFIEEAEVDAWLDSLDTDQELPTPSPRR